MEPIFFYLVKESEINVRSLKEVRWDIFFFSLLVYYSITPFNVVVVTSTTSKRQFNGRLKPGKPKEALFF